MSLKKVGLMLVRNPLVLPKLDQFTYDYLRYREHQLAAEARPFTQSFYYRKGTVGESHFIKAQEQVKTGTAQPAEDTLVQLKTAPLESDKEKDMHSLDRSLDKKLYLVVKEKEWVLPSGPVKEGEVLASASENRLAEYFGTKMETWTVGRAPVGHLESGKELTFFLKTHLLAGKIEILNKQFSDYKWLTRQEMEQELKPEYYNQIKDMLSVY
ncbi:hypothetical protein EDD86DRAFT_225710 [Gorgonomyces haynaldii]|nr:hypothetical protein EDD86DRAFT_225710 [Gorgonomyces haynaldii]